MSEKPTFTLDEHDLSAHGIMSVRVYGYEPVSVLSIRGDDPDACDCTVALKHLRLSGSPKALLAAFEAACRVLKEAVAHPELWDQLVTRRVAKGLPDDDETPISPFWALPAFDAGTGDDDKK